MPDTEKAQSELLKELIELKIENTQKMSAEESLKNSIVVDTKQVEIPSDICFSDLFIIEDIQRIQDDFSGATNVASIITQTDGTPITKPSNFCRLCIDIIRKTEIGCANCFKSDAEIGRQNQGGPIVQPCMSGGLWDAGASITIGGKHIANWLIGQVRNDDINDAQILKYADVIGADKEEFEKALAEVPVMPRIQFEKVAKSLFSLASELSVKAFQNFRQAQLISDLNRAKKIIKENERKFKNLLDNSPFHIWEFDGDIYNFVSKSYHEFTGLPENEILTPDIWVRYVHPDDLESAGNIWMNAWEKKIEHDNYFRLLGSEGVYRDFWCHAVPIFDETGNFKNFQGYNIDITERKEAEEYLSESEEKFKAIANYSASWEAWFNPQGKLVWMNTYSVNLTGYTPEEYIASEDYLSMVIAEEDLAMVLERFYTALQGSSGENLETRINRKDGSKFWASVSWRPILDSKGRSIGFRTSTQDITGRKQMELALQESEEKHRILFMDSPDAYLIIVDGIFVDCNHASELMLGRTRNEIIGQPPEAFSPEYQPDGKKSSDSVLEKTRDAMLIGIQTFEWAHNRFDGSEFFVEVSIALINLNGRSALFSTWRDITKRKIAEEGLKESELKYRELVENSPDAIAIYVNGKIVFVNNECVRLMAASCAEELIGKSVIHFVHPDYRTIVIERMKKSVIPGTISPLAEERFVRLDGSEVEVEVKAMSIRYENKPAVQLIVSDISERKKSEEALRISEEKHRLLIENSHDIIYTLSTDGIFTFISPSWTALLGHSVSQVVGTSFQLFVHQDDLPGCVVWLQKVIDSGERQEGVEYRVRHIDGSWYWHTSSAVPLKDVSGNIKGFYGTARDITERKLAEESLKQISARLKMATRAGGVGVFDFDIVNNVLVWDDQMLTLYGVAKENFGGAYETWYAGVHPDDREQSNLEVQMAIRGEKEFDTEFRVCWPDGSIHIIRAIAIVQHDNFGVPLRLVGTNWDITAQKLAEKKLRESEEKLSTLFASMTEMVVLHELVFNEYGQPINYRITDCNDAFTQSTSIKKEDAIGKLSSEVYGTEIAPYLAEFSEVALTGIPYEYTTFFAPMDKHFKISVVSPKKNQFATITTDITAIRQIQEVISAKNKELENYLYVASHDLRSPLVNIQGFSKRLQKNVDSIKTLLHSLNLEPEIKTELETISDETIPKTLDFIFTNVYKMDVLINGLLQISRTGRVRMTIKKIDINQLLNKVIASLNYQITEISGKVMIEDMPACFGDENLLNQLFTNIMTNAIKYRDSNRAIIIDISANTLYNKVIYRIKDNGIGIAARHLERIWDVFYRVNSASPDSGEGIGLSLCKRIADKHKGKIWAESSEGEGSIFYIELLTNEFGE